MIQWEHVLSQFLVVFCPDIPEEVSWHQTKRVASFFSSPWSRLLNISSLKRLRIWGPTKNPSLIFASLSRGNFSARYLNADLVRSMAFTKFFNGPSFMCRGGSRILCHSASAGCCTFFSPTFRDFLWVQSVFRKWKVFPRLSHSHKKKTVILRTSQLETHQERHYLQVTTNMPAILAVFKLIQQLLRFS